MGNMSDSDKQYDKKVSLVQVSLLCFELEAFFAGEDIHDEILSVRPRAVPEHIYNQSDAVVVIL